jgi:ABC-type branched-subunit amino acid transport system permease subunit
MELVGKEAELRRRFGRMDSAIRESKNMSQSLGKLGEGQ